MFVLLDYSLRERERGSNPTMSMIRHRHCLVLSRINSQLLHILIFDTPRGEGIQQRARGRLLWRWADDFERNNGVYL